MTTFAEVRVAVAEIAHRLEQSRRENVRLRATIERLQSAMGGWTCSQGHANGTKESLESCRVCGEGRAE